MAVRFRAASLPGVILCEPDAFPDPRGYFTETFHVRRYADAGIDCPFVQDNFSHSVRGTLRGLHYQMKQPQSKLVYTVRGSIFDVAVDIRRGSPTFGRWVSAVLSAENRLQMFIPAGFAHGFCVLDDTADVVYKCSDFYCPGDDRGVLWCDPALGIEWPVTPPLLSDKDGNRPRLRDVPPELLPEYAASL